MFHQSRGGVRGGKDRTCSALCALLPDAPPLPSRSLSKWPFAICVVLVFMVASVLPRFDDRSSLRERASKRVSDRMLIVVMVLVVMMVVVRDTRHR